MPVENPILARLNRQELLIAPERGDWFQSCLQQLATHPKATELSADTVLTIQANNDDNFWPAPDDWKAAYRPYIVKRGILQIPVFGVLLNRFSYQFGRYATGYTYLLRAVQRGMGDPEVKGIAWIHDSPGGEVAGNFELVDKIFEFRGTKPMRAFSAEAMYSASYSIGSAADDISVTRTAGVGSIGVVTAHVDYSGLMANAGIKVTFIFAGKHKVDGNPYEALPESVKARIQARIDRLYSIFTSTVARNRAIDEDDVRATEAATFTAEEAVEVGLADRVGIFEEELEAWTASLEANDETAKTNTGDENMASFTQEQHDKAVADARAEEQAKATAATNAAVTAAATSAKTRITAIEGSDEGKKRPIAARSAAMNTDMSVEQATAFLATLPEEKPPVASENKTEGNATAFKDAMGKDAPNVGAGGDKSGSGDTTENAKNPLLTDYAAAGGMKSKAA